MVALAPCVWCTHLLVGYATHVRAPPTLLCSQSGHVKPLSAPSKSLILLINLCPLLDRVVILVRALVEGVRLALTLWARSVMTVCCRNGGRDSQPSL